MEGRLGRFSVFFGLSMVIVSLGCISCEVAWDMTIENHVKWKMLLEVIAVGQETVRGICPVDEYQVRVEGLKVKV
jgi:hypothetical protein